jgi:DNA polymerase (family 10)
MPSYKVGMTLKEAQNMAQRLIKKLRALGAKQVEVTGSVLREEPEIGDIDLIVEGPIDEYGPKIGEVKGEGKERVTLIFENQQVNLFRGSEENWGAMRFYLTGPTRYVIAYRMKAKKKGWLLNQHGLFDEDGKLLEAKDEARLYELLDKTWKHPTKRGKR